MGEQIGALEKELKQVGKELSAARKKAGQRLVPLVREQLGDLGMKEAAFSVEFQTIQTELTQEDPSPNQKSKIKNQKSPPPPEPAPLALNDFSTASGLETVELMIAPNPGQPARPLRRIASGGELSRVMLALKGILAQADRVSVLVFDEIDANVGGRMGTVIGEKLRALAGVHQVLCITHLPQIAAFADRHLTIRKQMAAGETVTTVAVMEGEMRVRELAEMTSGKVVTETALAQARELLEAGRPKGKTRRGK